MTSAIETVPGAADQSSKHNVCGPMRNPYVSTAKKIGSNSELNTNLRE